MGNQTHSKVERRLEHLKAVAKQAGVKLTHQRLEIFRELAASEDHPGVDAIFRAVQRRMPTVSLDTVYRTLWMLHDLGLVATLGPERDGVRFDGNLDLNALRIPEAVKGLGSIADAHVEVRGVCTKCLAQHEASSGTASTPRRTKS
jgi:Fur family peroxide stress response transcriptional regulator